MEDMFENVAKLTEEANKKNNNNTADEPVIQTPAPAAAEENKKENEEPEEKPSDADKQKKEKKDKATQLEEVGTKSYAEGMMAAINNLGKQEWIHKMHEGHILGVPGKVGSAVWNAPSNMADGYRYMRDVGGPKISEAAQGAATAIGNKVSEAASKAKNFSDGLATELSDLKTEIGAVFTKDKSKNQDDPGMGTSNIKMSPLTPPDLDKITFQKAPVRDDQITKTQAPALDTDNTPKPQ